MVFRPWHARTIYVCQPGARCPSFLASTTSGRATSPTWSMWTARCCRGTRARRSTGRSHALITILLSRSEQQYATRVFVEQRIRVSERRYRVPDVCLMAVEHTADEVFA